MTVNPGGPATPILGKPDRPKSFDDGHDGQPHRDDLDERADQGLVGHGVMDEAMVEAAAYVFLKPHA